MKLKGFVFVLLMSFLGGTGFSQNMQQNGGQLHSTLAANEWIANMAEELSEQGGEELAIAFVEYYSQLLSNPLKINYASREQLCKLVILTDFHIESILEYRENSGNILSKTELSLLNGFDESIACVLSPFLDFSTSLGGEGSVFGGEPIKRFAHSLLLKSNFEQRVEGEIGEPVFLQLRYKCVYKNRFQLALTLENDAGEKIIGPGGIPFGDFISIHLAAKDLKFKKWEIKKIVLGDYSAKFGQGLVIWNSFNMQGNSSVAALCKRADAISAYTSSTEYGYLRGVGATFSKQVGRNLDHIDLSLFFSYNGVDATVKNGKYTSLSANGLHNTETLLKRKRAIMECVFGANLKLGFQRFNLGVSWASYGYNAKNGVKLSNYNKFQQYDGIHGNIGVDFYWLLNSCRVFGEVAFDYSADIAAIVGVTARLGEWDLGALARYYSKGYIAPHSGGYSSSGGTYNQMGLALSGARYLWWGTQLSFGVDGAYYPWYRYNIPSETYQVKGWAKLEHISDYKAWSVKLYNNFTSNKSINKVGVKGYFSSRVFWDWLQVKPRGEIAYCKNLSGYLAADIVAHLCQGRLRFYLRGAYYNCKDWLGRLYIYENDLPASFSSKLMYGEGLSGYFMAQYRNYKFGSIYLKIDSDLLFKVGLKSEF